ncbi:hypothetical protein [Poseidonibacter lekithochrous]|uniref:hypothetical protein n=1 Tax=Poseidonibacter lekithochrous TaxID=1904463 RepID=UPI0008FC3B6F|nr:hypothetical protein [Poseidonibacter lekithochrous]QKJ23081.1 hypothetical protein ALEK_1813 [Poseidonibacter lekithochrous]
MILIGDKLVPFEEISNILNIEDIKTTKANSTIAFGYNEKIMKYSFENDLNSAIIVNSIKESIYANALNAKYIIANKNLAKDIQKTAENYMFDSKVLAIIESNEEIEEIASYEIDGVIFKTLLG